eukprot:9471413-Pyramimonas_sp.AAC.2
MSEAREGVKAPNPRVLAQHMSQDPGLAGSSSHACVQQWSAIESLLRGLFELHHESSFQSAAVEV